MDGQLSPGPATSRFSSTNQPRWGGERSRHGGTLRTVCPHCEAPAKVRSSKTLTPLYRELRFQCSNVDGDNPCGHTFIASFEITRTIVPSARPNPRIRLPQGMPRPTTPANDDDVAVAANG